MKIENKFHFLYPLPGSGEQESLFDRAQVQQDILHVLIGFLNSLSYAFLARDATADDDLASVFRESLERPGLTPSLVLHEQFRSHFGSMEARQYVRSGAQFGRKLGQLSRMDGWKDRIGKEERRIGKNNQKQTLWTVRKLK